MLLPQNGLLVDPFAGSGTSLVACKRLNRKAIGIEIEEKFCRIIIERLSQCELGLGTLDNMEVSETAANSASTQIALDIMEKVL
jgi:tRNA G10  N-methylase Trm11